MDLENLVIEILDSIKEADENGAAGILVRFNKEQVHKIAEAYRNVDWIEIY